MSSRVVAVFAIFTLLPGLPATASAQSAERVAFGVALALAHLPGPDPDEPAFPYVEAPYGNSTALEIFGSARVSGRIAVGGEVSLASPVTLTTIESHSGSYASRTMTHRDRILVGLLRVRTGRFVDVVGGGGVVFPRTLLTVSGWNGGPGGSNKIYFGPTDYESPSNGATPALTMGADAAPLVQGHVALVGIVRLHHLFRDAPLRSSPFGKADDERPFLQPGANVIRLGVGVRIGF